MTFSDDANFHARRVERVAADFEQDARQRPARWPRQRLTRFQVERAVVTGAQKSLLLRIRHDGECEVRAFLAESYEIVFASPHQQTPVMLFGISEDQRLADLQFVEFGDLPDRRLAAPLAQVVLHGDPELTDDESEAGQDHKLPELPPP